MLFFLACFTNTHPSTPPQLEKYIYEMQQHVQRIEDLSNQLLSAQQKQDTVAVQKIIMELNHENKLLQNQKDLFQNSLKVSKKKD